MKSKFYLLLFITTLIFTSCGKAKITEKSKINAPSDSSIIIDNNTKHNPSLSKIKIKNDVLIRNRVEILKNNLLRGDFKSIYKNADSSMTNLISEQDLVNHFNFISKYYGNIASIKDHGSIMTAYYKTDDYVAYLKNGDSLLINAILVLKENDAKLTYLGVKPFDKNIKPERFSTVSNIIDNILNKDINKLYNTTNSLFKSKLNLTELKAHINKYITNEDRFIVESHLPLIFGRNKIGVVSNVNFFKDTILSNKVKIITVYEKSNELKLEDIQFNTIKK